MKMLYAIIQDEDERSITRALVDNEYYVTRVASSGGFLKKGSTTLIMGVADDQVDQVIDIIRSHTHRTTTSLPVSAEGSETTVNTGGATIFVLNSLRYEKF